MKGRERERRGQERLPPKRVRSSSVAGRQRRRRRSIPVASSSPLSPPLSFSLSLSVARASFPPSLSPSPEDLQALQTHQKVAGRPSRPWTSSLSFDLGEKMKGGKGKKRVERAKREIACSSKKKLLARSVLFGSGRAAARRECCRAKVARRGALGSRSIDRKGERERERERK